MRSVPQLFTLDKFLLYNDIKRLPLFTADADHHPWPQQVLSWREVVLQADAVIISTPAYLDNIPALLKNALEWLTSSGELAGKPVLPITFTPHPPRGEKAMQSLIWSLMAMDARIVVQLGLYQDDIEFAKDGSITNGDGRKMILEAMQLLLSS